MTKLQIAWMLLALFWVSAELFLLWRSRRLFRSSLRVIDWGGGAARAGSSRWFWLVLGVSLSFALYFKTSHFLPMPGDANVRQFLAMPLFCIGLLLRLCAIVTLGRHFNTRVVLHADHVLLCHGPYRYLRHPAYSGLLLAFAAAGIAMGDGLSFLILVLPLSGVLVWRIRHEEALMLNYFQADYHAYMQRSWCLIPYVY